MKAVTTQFRLPGYTLAAKEWGTPGGIPILALHGWMDNANTFDHIAPLLEGVHLIALDLAGHGHSGHQGPGGAYYLWDHVADVAEVVRQLGWKRFSLLGHSMGGGIATWFAGTFPRKVERLALIDGFGAAFSMEADRLPTYLERAIRRRQMAGMVPIERFVPGQAPQFSSLEEAIAERRNGKFGKLTEVAARTLLARGLETVPGGYRWRNDPRIALPALMEPNEETISAFIQRVTAPTYLILGDQGLFAKGEKAHRLAHFEHLRVKTLAGGHHLHLEPVATEIAAQLQSFFLTSLQPSIPIP